MQVGELKESKLRAGQAGVDMKYIHTFLAILDPRQRNWFLKSQLTAVVVIGPRKPYAKMKVSKSFTGMMFIDS